MAIEREGEDLMEAPETNLEAPEVAEATEGAGGEVDDPNRRLDEFIEAARKEYPQMGGTIEDAYMRDEGGTEVAVFTLKTPRGSTTMELRVGDLQGADRGKVVDFDRSANPGEDILKTAAARTAQGKMTETIFIAGVGAALEVEKGEEGESVIKRSELRTIADQLKQGLISRQTEDAEEEDTSLDGIAA